MKAKVTGKHAGSSDPGPWLAQLHHDGGGGPGPRRHVRAEQETPLTRPYVASPGGAAAAEEPPGGVRPLPAILRQCISPDDGIWPQEWRGHAPPKLGGGEGNGSAPGTLMAPPPVTARAVIGDELRRPALWCQLGACISRYADPEAIGEADNRTRALQAGWREDALGRFACPSCLQQSTEFRVRYPVVRWDKKRAVAMAILMTVAARQHRFGGAAAGQG